MSYRLLFALTFIFLTECLQAQTPNFSMHSPNAYAFSKIDNIPMNNFTGMANINLPLYEKKMSVLNFNMGLTYTGGGGLKVNQMGSIIGKGWLLHTGGVIVRHTRGIPDDYRTTSTLSDGTPVTGSNGILYNNGVTYMPDGSARITPNDPTFNYSNGLADSQHDIFEFNIPGKSGKFYIGKDRQVVIVTDSKVKIIPDFTTSTLPEFKLGSFLIIDEAGIKYHFDQIEVTKENSNYNVPSLYYNKEYASSWLLTKIEAPFSEESITYQYVQTGAWVYGGGPANSIYVKRSDLASGTESGGSGGGGAKEVNLQSITFSDQSQINFNYYPIVTYSVLKSIDILNPQQEIVKTYNLNYKEWEVQNAFSYTNTLPGTLPYGNVDRWNHYLTSVDAVSSSSNHQTVFAFDYFLDQTLNEYTIPNGYDYWGYYNGKTNATPYLVATQWGPAADRTPDANYAKFGLIKKIVYPTGGSEEFEYELNDKRGTSGNVTVAGLRIKKRTLHDGISPQNDIIKQYNYVETDGLSSGFLGETPVFSFVTNTYIDNGGWPTNPTLEYSTTLTFSNPVNPLSSIDGSFAGYRRVEEVLQNGSNSNGKIVYEYSDLSYTTLWDPIDYYPYRPVDRPYWAIGLPLTTTYYSSAGAITKKVVNEYNLFQQQKVDDNYRSLYVSQDAQINFDPVNGSGNFSGEIFTFRNYYPIVGRAELKATHEYNYPSTTETTATELLTQNTYDPNYFMLRTSSQSNSDGNTVTRYFYYPFDYNIGTSFLNAFTASNIINQPILTESWLNKSGSNYLIQSGVTDYQTLSNGVIRPLTAYTARLAQPLPGTPGTFSSTVLLPPDHNFQPAVKFNAYDNNSRLVEFQNQGGAKSAIILDKSGNTLAKADNASFNNIAYTGFETDDMGNWVYTSSGISSSSSKSGSKSFNGSITKSSLTSGNYTVSLWASGNGSVTVNGVNQTINSNWNYYTWSLTGITSVTITTNGNLVDQVALYPQGAQMATANYFKGIEMESTTDAKGQNSYFEHDDFNRLINIKDQNFNIVKSYVFHYKAPFFSVLQSGSYAKNDCPASPGSPTVSGPPLTYTVPAGRYTSILSQADADAQALSDVLFGNGQVYANANGTCVPIYYNSSLSVLFTRNNCTAGTTPGQIYYNVAANTYNSTISQADADAKAQNDANTNGQNYANANCVCAPSITVTFTNSTSDQIGINFSTGINFQAGSGYFRSYTCPVGTSSIVLPAGTYTVSLSNINSSTSHHFYVGSRTAIVGTNASFSNVNISNGTNKEDNVGIY